MTIIVKSKKSEIYGEPVCNRPTRKMGILLHQKHYFDMLIFAVDVVIINEHLLLSCILVI